uniref:BREX-2 system phosphatase PglZ n=1 Tax=Nocardiopsis gilva TaxID=280236 RepID=UPI00035F54EE
ARRKDVRDAAAAVIPSVTRLSRSSLLAGKLTAGGQSVEKEGFAAFWAGRKDPDAVLFHKAEIAGTAGKRLSDELQYALAGKSAVGVVLNTVDDSLDKAAQGDRTGWRIADVTFLDELLGAARSYGRPVVIVSDHGHVLERGDLDSAPSPTGRNEASAARWRTGTAAGDGEMLLSGPRVLEGDGPEGNRRVVVPWREDIRYTQRKGGYHGGASLAEMTVPVLVFLPSSELLPAGWSLLAPERVTPTWWETQRLGAAGSDGGRMPAAGAPAPTEVDAQPAVSGVRAQHGPRASQAVGTGSSQRAVHGSGRADSSSAPATPTGGPSVAGQGEGASAGPLGTAAQHPAAADGKSGAPHSSSPSLGSKIVESAVFREQRKFVRRGPKSPQVSAAIDALAAADGTLSTTGVAAAAGFPPARAGGLMVMLQRLLNVEGYPVLEFVDGGARLKLNTGLARQQFQVDAE